MGTPLSITPYPLWSRDRFHAASSDEKHFSDLDWRFDCLSQYENLGFNLGMNE